jgi:serine/threonine protein kinase/tetratricopeptide (TPR) repeat protein
VDERSIFMQALDLDDPREQEAYVRRVCGDDDPLRGRIEALLRSHRAAGSFVLDRELTADLAVTMEPSPLIERPGAEIGPYTLREPIGEGGMGVVFVAEQSHPVRRKVALKVIKPGMDTAQVIARFEVERQALALMDHPNIARVVDAGATDTGRPYFVMELVSGVPITAFCDQNQLAIPERLELFVLVCRAVQHAHQKGIIHRDLKPSNVLVTLQDGVPVPKIIDFGIAKATGQGFAGGATLTGVAQVIGTPMYMSPEQADGSGHDVDTRSDVYSLGVLLYELLTGTTPFEPDALHQAALDEIRRRLREQEPPAPSTRLNTLSDADRSSVSANRQTDPRRLGRTLHGELDWIVMKCLEKDRTRRYESVSGLAGDLMRYLTNQPVEAGPPSAWYRFTKYARRNRVGLVTTSLVATAILAGATASTWQAVRATRAQAEARIRAEESRLVLDYLVQDVFGAAHPDRVWVQQGRTLTVNEILTRGEKAISARFARRPLVEAKARQAIGEAFLSLSRHPEAQQQFRRAAEIRARLLGSEHPEVLATQCLLVSALGGEGYDYFRVNDELEPLARHVFEAHQRVLGPKHPATLHSMFNLIQALRLVGKLDEALELVERMVVLDASVLGPDHNDTLVAHDCLGGVLDDLGRFVEAEAVYRRLLDARLRVFGPDDFLTIQTRKFLANTLRHQGRLDEALALQRECVEFFKQMLGPTHPVTLNFLNEIAAALEKKSDPVALRDFYERSLREMLEAPPDPDPSPDLRERRSTHMECFARGLLKLPEPIPIDVDLAVRASEEVKRLSDGLDANYLNLMGAILVRKSGPFALRDFCERSLREILAAPLDADPNPDLRERRWAPLAVLARRLVSLPELIPIDMDLAVRAAEEAGRLSDGKAGCVTRAFVYSRAGRDDLAVQAIEKAKARPDWANLEDDYGWLVEALIRARRGELIEARRLYDQARNRPKPTAFGQEQYQGLQRSVEALIGLDANVMPNGGEAFAR